LEASYVSEVECVQEVTGVVRLPQSEGRICLSGSKKSEDSGFQHGGEIVFDSMRLSMVINLDLMFNCVPLSFIYNYSSDG
jgi:hypothetical protein